MKTIKFVVLPILLATIWISLNEFIRNQVFLIDFWTNHYTGLGIEFPMAPINGAVWGIWSLVFAVAIYLIARKSNMFETLAITWMVGFVLMWLVVGNMSVLPFAILWYAIPWSMFEVVGAVILIKKTSTR